jgi:hypothetical protein
MPHNLGPKLLKMKKGDIVSQVQGNLRVVCWKDKWEFYVLTNIHAPPAEGNFRDESGNPVKPLVVEDCNIHMGYVDKSNRWPSAMACVEEPGNRQRSSSFISQIWSVIALIIHRSFRGIMTHKISDSS